MYHNSTTYASTPSTSSPSSNYPNKYDYISVVKSSSHPYGYNNVPPLSVDPNQAQQPMPQPALYSGPSITNPGHILTPSATPPQPYWNTPSYSDLHFNDPRTSSQPSPQPTRTLSHEPSSMMYMPTYDPSSFQQPPNHTISFPATTPPLPTPQPTTAPHHDPNSMYRPPAINYSRPKLSTTIWEDEGTVCYQVDAKGICVARRQDNDMVNGTKLLNVAGMSRGKRDGILKNEKGRVVVKVGAMHLKGVWVTFSRAKTLASQYKISDILYPLFVNDPSVFLYSTTLPSTPRPSTYNRQTPQRSISSNTSITWQSSSSNENDQAYDTGFPSSTQSQHHQASVQTDILSSDNSYILDYSRNQFTVPAMVPYNQQVPDYFASEGDNSRYRM